MYVLNIALALYVYLYLSELALLPLASRERKKGRPMWQSIVVVFIQVRSQKEVVITESVQSVGTIEGFQIAIQDILVVRSGPKTQKLFLLFLAEINQSSSFLILNSR